MKISPYIILLTISAAVTSCKSEIQRSADHYLEHRDYKSLNRVVELLKTPVDTNEVITLLGPSINTGIDLRYFADTIGPTGCTVGAALVYNSEGKVFHKWIGELCE